MSIGWPEGSALTARYAKFLQCGGIGVFCVQSGKLRWRNQKLYP
jgi:hypothetical protein